MLARPVAVFCLLFAAILTARAGSPEPARLYLFLRGGTPPAPEFSALKDELASLMREATISVNWEDTVKPRTVDGSVVVVELEGDCAVRARAEVRPGPDSAPLGSSAVANGHIQPFARVDCVALSAVLTSRLAAQPAALRSRLYGRAMARVLAHELYHYIGQAREHLQAGLAREKFSVSDLLQEQFEFDGLALSRLRNSQSTNNELTNPDNVAHMSTTGQ
jgi:hypothetical protein